MKWHAPWIAARRAWCLSEGAYQGESLVRRLKQNLRWALAAAARPRAAMAWFSHLQTQDLVPFKEANPILAFKPMRAYLSSRWSLKRRTKVMTETYGYVRWRGGIVQRALLQRSGGSVLLASFSLGDQGEGQILLGVDNRFRKEGEFAVTFSVPEKGGRICSLSFALEWRNNGLALFVGCVQGSHREGEEGLMKALGKAMHGLRPKALVVYATQEIARTLGAREMYGAGNEIQVHRRKHLIHLSWTHELTFDYDTFWQELGGHLAFDGWFYLPRRAKRRTREEIKPNKRTLYTRRYAFQDDIAAQLKSVLAKTRDPGGEAP